MPGPPPLNRNAPARWRLPPVAWALVAQLLALLGSAGVAMGAAFLGRPLSAPELLTVQALLAVVSSARLGLAPWWWPLQAAFVPAAVALAILDVPAERFLLGFALLALVYGSTYRTQVPLYLSRRHVWEAVGQRLSDTTPQRFIDLGCGLGGLVAYLARCHPRHRIEGIESAFLPWLVSVLRLARTPGAVCRFGDFWRLDLGDYDVVFAYLSPVPMPALWEKVRREMKPGTLFISYRFPVPGVAAHEVVELGDFARTRLYLWRM